MSDSIEELVRAYEEHVYRQGYPRSIGLFPIPEYPELEPRRGMWSTALDTILTTLRYLAPATLLTIFWGQQSFFFKLLKHIDSAFRAIVFSSEEQKQSVLIWLAEAGPVRVEHLETVWRHGWIVCAVLDAALPGACTGHPPTRLSLKHAQAIADHYLGVEPVFSRQELDSNDSLSKHQEWKLATFLDRIRQSLAKLTPPVSKPPSQRTSPETTQFTLDYVARGSGLTAAQLNNKSHFKIYPTSQQSLDPGEITILIRGPKDTYGMTVLPPILGKAQLIRQKLLGLNSKPNYTENILPITQGATYLRSYGKMDMNKTYHIPKTSYDIEIEAEPRGDHTKISYVVNLEGKYDISITSRGQSIVGSPFTVTGSRNILSILEKESFSLEDGEEIDIVDIKSDRKVVLRIVDFVTEKMLLKENGSLEKISDDEAKVLMATDTNDKSDYIQEERMTTLITEQTTTQKNKEAFYSVVIKVILINRVIKVFNELMTELYIAKQKKEKASPYHRNQQDIPDIVNSTLSDTKMNPFILSEVRSKYIIPENINVSLKTEKSYGKELNVENVPTKSPRTPHSNNRNNYEISEQEKELFNIYESNEEDEIMTISSSPGNPFLIDTYTQNYKTEKDLGTYVTTEYETNNSQNEEFPESPIKILIEEDITSSPHHNNNPFIDTDVVHLERPKTPVLKIISGDLKNRNDSVYVDPRIEQLSEQIFGNEFINPFFIHQHHQSKQLSESLPLTDFIIGAPVSLPPMLRTSTPEPNLNSLIITKEEIKVTEDTFNDALDNTTNEETKSEFSTPLHTNSKPKMVSEKTNKKVNIYSTASSSLHSLDSNLAENIEIFNMSDTNLLEAYQNDTITSNVNKSPNKEIWDSAYVSIDDNNSSPDTNNNDNTQVCESISKQKFALSHEELSNMGPAERELWKTCNELKEGFNTPEDAKNLKWESRKSNFTPIIEESDRSISSGMKDVSVIEISQTKIRDSDPVTVAFAELNDMFEDYFPKPETDSNSNINEEEKLTTSEVDNKLKTNDFVNSASEITDVKRHTNDSEGKISEVQANVTESVSVSQPLPYQIQDPTEESNQNYNEIQFGGRSKTNIVIERKKYWDDRIRQIEAKSQETTTFQKKRRLSTKHLRYNDSLTKRRGKQIVKNFLGTCDHSQKTATNNEDNKFDQIHNQSLIAETSNIDVKPDIKLVDKWKKYWDDKLESENNNPDTTISSKDRRHANSEQTINQNNGSDFNEGKQTVINLQSTTSPVKQELPEEVFKAFETSPKRFFGTSRKQILNKIDTFLGKPSIEDNTSSDVPSASRESGLVSSRILLFHSISRTEELSWERRKCQSLHNIIERNDSNKERNCLDTNLEITDYTNMENNIATQSKKKSISNDQDDDSTIMKEKRSRIALKTFNKSFDETTYQKPTQMSTIDQNLEQSSLTHKEKNFVKNTIKDLNKQDQRIKKYKNIDLRRKSFSKSEMDIFNKATTKESEDDLEKYKSCDELPKINVKNFISLYESVSKTSVDSKSTSKLKQMSSESYKQWQANNSRSVDVNKRDSPMFTKAEDQSTTTSPSLSSKTRGINKSFESISSTLTDMKTDNESVDVEINDNQESSFLSLSDIELEIIENSTDQSSKSPTPEKDIPQTDYKSRFKMAKQYFQSLEELVEPKKPRKLNECELLLESKSSNTTESAEKRPQKRVKKNIKSHSMPSSEISKIWHQLQDNMDTESGATKLMKISEKFNVEDLFTDVMEGRLSRQGSLRGIPHKKAVLETFKSMENLNDKKYSPYEIAVSQLNDFAKENKIKNAQTFLTEYPYLPTTDPSRYHSRVDTRASGLISLKEIINIKPRRNSVPDLRLNPTFTVNL
ncbi:unnamed protein product [Chilo suppressalis]|uniref:Calponin-homology (CH) domain-containing protein n=1 Tax=Chilo suppressalis TaxID=168631 RepID=A0ABN8L5V0_CHISP|nr:unnamed protein product [Chilo suppressalis]